MQKENPAVPTQLLASQLTMQNRVSCSWVDDKEIALHDIFKIPRLCGTFPFKRDFKISVPFLIYTVLLKLVQFSVRSAIIIDYFYYIALKTDVKLINSVDLGRAVIIGEYVARHLTCLFIILWLVYRRKDLRDLCTVGQRLHTPKLNSNLWRKYCLFNVEVFIAALVEIIFIIRALIRGNTEQIYECVDFLLTYPTIFANMNLFLGLMAFLKTQIQSNPILKNTDAVLKWQEILTSQCHRMNEFYGPIVLMMNIHFFFYMLLIFVVITFGEVLFEEPIEPYFTFIWFILSVLGPLKMTFASTIVTHQVNKINKVLYGRALSKPDDEALEFHMIAKREVVFSACGFFTLDNSLICSMIATATTYLVILLQIPAKDSN